VRRGERLKIYTKTGDDGETGLFGAGRVSKDHLRVDAYGQVDELNAAIGLAMALDPRTFCRELLETVQRDLFTIGAELATPDAAKLAKALRGPPVGVEQVNALEHAIDRYETQVPSLKQFVLPGGVPKAAALHLARTVCRRAERAVVRFQREHQTGGLSSVLPYLNRLSDLLFVLARGEAVRQTGHRTISRRQAASGVARVSRRGMEQDAGNVGAAFRPHARGPDRTRLGGDRAGRRRGRRRGRLRGGDLPARHPLRPGAHHPARHDRLLDRWQNGRGRPGREEPARRIPPAPAGGGRPGRARLPASAPACGRHGRGGEARRNRRSTVLRRPRAGARGGDDTGRGSARACGAAFRRDQGGGRGSG